MFSKEKLINTRYEYGVRPKENEQRIQENVSTEVFINSECFQDVQRVDKGSWSVQIPTPVHQLLDVYVILFVLCLGNHRFLSVVDIASCVWPFLVPAFRFVGQAGNSWWLYTLLLSSKIFTIDFIRPDAILPS